MTEKQKGSVCFAYPDGDLLRNENEGLTLWQIGEQDHTRHNAAFSDPGQALLLYVTEGAVQASCDEETEILTEHTAAFFPPGCPRGIVPAGAEQSFRVMYLRFSLEKLPKSDPLCELYAFYLSQTVLQTAPDFCDVPRYFTDTMSELCEKPPKPYLVCHLIQQILVAAYRDFSQNQPPPLQEQTVQSVGFTTYAIIRYVDEHLYTITNLNDMAAELGYSYNYLSHLFRRKTGMTIQSYVSAKKIEKSKELLRDGTRSVTDIAAMLNYDCIQSFGKAFKRETSMSPSEYRALLGL